MKGGGKRIHLQRVGMLEGMLEEIDFDLALKGIIIEDKIYRN